MLKGTRVYIILFGLSITISCRDRHVEEKDKEPVKPAYKLDKFNELSTFFILDSIQELNNKLTINFTDTSKFYQPVRHIQNYSLVFLAVLDPANLNSGIDSVTFDVRMLYREDGDIVQTYSSKELLPVLQRYANPKVKDKILELNRFNKQDYITRTGDNNLDVLYKLNMYFAQIVDPGSWVGVDSYGIIWEYEFNKAGGYDMTGHLDAFNKILTDTLYMKEREVGQEIHKILMK